MAFELRKTGINVVGDLPWGAHFCYFYETKQDLLDILIPYFKTGLENKEFCLWVISNSELLTVKEATSALRNALPDLDRYVAKRSIEVVDHEDWFLSGKTFDPHQVANRFKAKLNEALARGYAGMRVNGSPAWLHNAGQKELRKFEAELDKLFPNERTIASCTYPLATIGADEIFDVVRTHQFAIARRQGEWEVIETPELIQAKQEIKRLNEELEQRVIERTNDLRVANEELRKEIAERKQAEALLHAKEQEFRVIVENAPDQIIRYDREFRRVYINPAVARAYGLPVEALIGKPIGAGIQYAAPDIKAEEVAKIRQRIEAVFSTGETSEFELTWSLPTGRTYFSVRFFPERDLEGSVTHVLGISRDITERILAEEELKKEKEILDKIFANIPVMIGFVGEDGQVKLVNREWERTIGWTLEELHQQNVDIFAEAYPDPQYRQRVLDFVASSTGEWVDLKIKVRDGRVIDAACAVVHLSDGTRVAIAQDITERKLAEDALRRSEDHLRLVIDAIPTMAWSLGPEGVVDFLNQRWMDYTGLSLEQFIKEPTRPIHPEDIPRVVKRWRAEEAAGEPYDDEMRLRRANGEYRWFLVRTAPLRDEQGNLIKWYGVSIDIEDRKRAEEELKATSEHLRALSARLQSAKEEEDIRIAREIHDEMGSTLTSLRWELERLDKTISEAEDWSQLQALRAKIEEMMRLTDITIGTMRRIASELRPSVLDDLGLAEAIEWQIEQFQIRTGIVCRCDCALENLDFEPEQSTAIFRIFQEALTNVLSHAGASMVEVVAREDDGEFVLTITDNGRGITEDEKSGRLSLGILGMRERAHLIGGELEITGIEGRGTVVTVRMPIPGKSKSPKSKV